MSSFLKRRTQLKKTNKKSEHFFTSFRLLVFELGSKKGSLGKQGQRSERRKERERERGVFFCARLADPAITGGPRHGENDERTYRLHNSLFPVAAWPLSLACLLRWGEGRVGEGGWGGLSAGFSFSFDSFSLSVFFLFSLRFFSFLSPSFLFYLSISPSFLFFSIARALNRKQIGKK